MARRGPVWQCKMRRGSQGENVNMKSTLRLVCSLRMPLGAALRSQGSDLSRSRYVALLTCLGVGGSRLNVRDFERSFCFNGT